MSDKNQKKNKELQKIGDYILEKTIGRGQFGKVFKARHSTTGEVFAIKKLDKKKFSANPQLMKLLKTEVAIMNEIKHPNILRLYEYLASRDSFYIVIQFCNQGDLESYMSQRDIKFFPQEKAVQIMRQIFSGFSELRKRKILHRDFKLANIFMHDEKVVIGDFGFAKSGQELAETKLGSPLTMAPELLFSSEEEVIYNSKADLWSIGVVFYQLLFGETPFWGLSVPELISSIKQNSGQNLKFPRQISEETKDFLRSLLVIDPAKRLDWNQCFEHPMFAKYPSKEESVSRLFNDIKSMALGDEPNSNRGGQQPRVLVLAPAQKQGSGDQPRPGPPSFQTTNSQGRVPGSNEQSQVGLSGLQGSLKGPSSEKFPLNSNEQRPQNQFGQTQGFERAQNKSADKVGLLSPVNWPKPSENYFSDKSLQNSTELSSACKEVGFRYSHERNKIYFLVYAAKKIQAGLKSLLLASCDCALFNLSLLILKKALSVNGEVLSSLGHQANTLRLNPVSFQSFLGSPAFKKAQADFLEDKKSLGDYYQLILGRTKRDGVALIPQCQLTAKEGSVPQLDQLISSEISNLSLKMKSKEFNSGVKRKALLQLLVVLKQVVCIDSNFPYFIDKIQAVKFDWNSLYFGIENASEIDLNNILHAN